jgi:type IV pilus assembly protein PilA
VLKHLQERRQDEQGFTLIELMVVVLIMGILMAIAIPTFLSTQGSANDASAKSNATNVLTSEKAYYEDNQVYLDAFAGATGNSLDPNMPWEATSADHVPTTGTVVAEAGVISATGIALGATGSGVLIMDLSKSGACFYIYDSEATATTPVLGYAQTTTGTGCVAPTGYALTQATLTAGHAGAAPLAAAPTAAGWYASW